MSKQKYQLNAGPRPNIAIIAFVHYENKDVLVSCVHGRTYLYCMCGMTSVISTYVSEWISHLRFGLAHTNVHTRRRWGERKKQLVNLWVCISMWYVFAREAAFHLNPFIHSFGHLTRLNSSDLISYLAPYCWAAVCSMLYDDHLLFHNNGQWPWCHKKRIVQTIFGFALFVVVVAKWSITHPFLSFQSRPT